MICYLLINYGPKPKGSLKNCFAAQQQIRNLMFAAETITGKREFTPAYDYAREVRGLDSLPALKSLLDKARKANATIFIDTFIRLFSNCPNEGRIRLLKELRDYSGHFKDIHSGEDIGSLSDKNLIRLVNAMSPVKFTLESRPQSPRRPDEKREQTKKATQASQAARTEAATQKSRELQSLKAELLKHQTGLTNADLAREANERGLLTTRRSKWSAASVNRALKRLD
ncbi:hypothetical protein PM01_08760 [Sulfitobacter pontiacus 3SOLIMAR09]|nr:hypothetical protein PM01_08760 [Sulfitobacter pontiacus 3SOLIMAR09]